MSFVHTQIIVTEYIIKAMLDISLVIFFVLNALSRPRLESANLVGIIYRDGIQFFLVSDLFELGSLNIDCLVRR